MELMLLSHHSYRHPETLECRQRAVGFGLCPCKSMGVAMFLAGGGVISPEQVRQETASHFSVGLLLKQVAESDI